MIAQTGSVAAISSAIERANASVSALRSVDNRANAGIATLRTASENMFTGQLERLNASM